jgi:hypothetical protein
MPPETAEAETGGGGRHLAFRRPNGLPVKDQKLGAGIDIKIDGYIVVAPSSHKSGRQYTWLTEADPFDGSPFTEPPRWLIEKLNLNNAVSPVPTQVSGLRYQKDANPPSKLWDALRTDDTLAGIWNRRRRPPNQRDDTPSAWTMSLRLRLLKYRLSPQEALDTMVAYRREHGDPAKSRKWFLSEAARYAADLIRPASPSPISEPPPALLRNPRQVDVIRETVHQAIRHGEQMPKRTSSERLLLIQLAEYARDGEFVWPSQERLAKTMGLTPDHISKLIRNLEKWECIEKVRHSGPGVNNKYRLRFLDSPHEHTA